MIPLLLALALLTIAHPAAAQQFDPMPLLGSAALDTGEIERERRAVLGWAKDPRNVPADQVPAARERVYFLIGSAVKQNLLAQHGHRPPFDMSDLAQLFELGAALGVHGAAEVARALPLRTADAMGASPPLPDGLSVEFAPPLLRVSSARGGWSAAVPYYFMIGDLQGFQANNGLHTEIVSVSTLFARNENRPGASQSTILLVFSPTKNVDEFNRFWLEQIGVGAGDAVADSPRPGAMAYRARDGRNDINKEVILFPTARGPMLVAYLGLTGPHAANRANFLDFLRHLQLP